MQKIILYSAVVFLSCSSFVAPMSEHVRPVATGVGVASAVSAICISAYMTHLSKEIDIAKREKRTMVALKLERRRDFLKKLVAAGSLVAAMSTVTYFLARPPLVKTGVNGTQPTLPKKNTRQTFLQHDQQGIPNVPVRFSYEPVSAGQFLPISFIDLTANEKSIIQQFNQSTGCKDLFLKYLLEDVASWDNLITLKNTNYSTSLFQTSLTIKIKPSFLRLSQQVFSFGEHSGIQDLASEIKSTLKTRLLFKQIQVVPSVPGEIKLIFRLNVANQYLFAVACCRMNSAALEFVFDHTDQSPGLIFSDSHDGFSYTLSSDSADKNGCFVPESTMIKDDGMPLKAQQRLPLAKVVGVSVKGIELSSPEGDMFDKSLEIKFSNAMQRGKFDPQNYRADRLNGAGLSAADLVPKAGKSPRLFDVIKRYVDSYSAWFVLPKWYLDATKRDKNDSPMQLLIKETYFVPIYKCRDDNHSLYGTPQAFYALQKVPRNSKPYYNIVTIFDANMVLENTAIYSTKVRDKLVLMSLIPIEEAMQYVGQGDPFFAAAAARRHRKAIATA